eukprot:9068847-Pyramimonas_sp.AAC.1
MAGTPLARSASSTPSISEIIDLVSDDDKLEWFEEDIGSHPCDLMSTANRSISSSSETRSIISLMEGVELANLGGGVPAIIASSVTAAVSATVYFAAV